MSDLETTRNRIVSLSNVIAAARQTLAADGDIDLDGVDTAVKEIVANLSALSGEEGQRLRTPLIALFDDVSRLEEDIRRRHGQLTKEIDGLSTRQRATAAYGNNPPKK